MDLLVGACRVWEVRGGTGCIVLLCYVVSAGTAPAPVRFCTAPLQRVVGIAAAAPAAAVFVFVSRVDKYDLYGHAESWRPQPETDTHHALSATPNSVRDEQSDDAHCIGNTNAEENQAYGRGCVRGADFGTE